MNVLCYYYLIGDYANYQKIFFDWYNNFKLNFCTEQKITYFLVTDNDSLMDNIHSDDIIIRKCDPVSNITDAKSFKFKYLKDNLDLISKYDYIHYSNSNLRCGKKISFNDLIFDNKKFTAITHPYFGTRNNFLKLNYGLNIGSSIEIQEDTKTFKYFQAGNWIGTSEEVIKLTEFIENKRCLDFNNNIILRWNDETYYNYYLNVVNKNNFNILDGSIWLS